MGSLRKHTKKIIIKGLDVKADKDEKLRPLRPHYANVYDMKLSGNLHCTKYIQCFVNLRKLDISGCANVENLSCMSNLDLWELNISRTNVSDLGPVRNLCNMRELIASYTKIIDLGPLVLMIDLKKLDVSYTKILNLIPIGGLIGLRDLNASGTDIKTVVCPFVRKLNICSTRIVDLCLTETKRIKYLSVSRSSIKDLSFVKKIDLFELDMSKCYFISDLTPLSYVTNLRKLDMSECTGIFDIEPLSRLTNLKELNMEGCWNISTVAPLKACSGLRVLDVRKCQHNLNLMSLMTGKLRIKRY